jgi:aryl-alcohol dehydrogenase-like predicted oxidoreductase
VNLRFLGRSGLRVSALALGTANFGSAWGGAPAVDEKTARNLLAAALDHGVNFVDTADIYGYGVSEAMLGKIMGRRRSKLVLATKVFGQMRPGEPESGGLSRRHVLEALDASLKRLRTDYLDLYMPHAWDDGVPIEETLDALNRAKIKGKIRVLAAANFSGEQFQRMLDACSTHRWHRVEVAEARCGLALGPISPELSECAVRAGVSVVAWGALGGGLLAEGVRSRAAGASRRWEPEEPPPAAAERNLAALRKILGRVAEREGLRPAQAAIGWSLGRPGVDSAIVSATTAAQLKVLLASRELSAESVAELDRARAT